MQQRDSDSIPQIRKPGPEMERIYRKHSSTSHSSEGRDSYNDPDTDYEHFAEHEETREDKFDNAKPRWKQDRNGQWKSNYMTARERAVENDATSEKTKSEPFYEYLQMIPNPNFFRPHVEFERNDRHHDDGDGRVLQEQRMQEQR